VGHDCETQVNQKLVKDAWFLVRRSEPGATLEVSTKLRKVARAESETQSSSSKAYVVKMQLLLYEIIKV
jgi:hypothetical protein